MIELSNLTIETAVAGQSGAMEADTIKKNGRSSKSHTSRVKISILFLALIICCTSVVAQERTFKSYAFRVLSPVEGDIEVSDRSNSLTISMENNSEGKRVFQINTYDSNGLISFASCVFDKQIDEYYRYSGVCRVHNKIGGTAVLCIVATKKPLSDFVTSGVKESDITKKINDLKFILELPNGIDAIIQIVPLM